MAKQKSAGRGHQTLVAIPNMYMVAIRDMNIGNVIHNKSTLQLEVILSGSGGEWR